MTVLPSAWACATAAGENGFQGILGTSSNTVKAKSPTSAATAAPPHHATIRRVGSVNGVRPIHQHANHRPTSSVIVGMT